MSDYQLREDTLETVTRFCFGRYLFAWPKFKRAVLALQKAYSNRGEALNKAISDYNEMKHKSYDLEEKIEDLESDNSLVHQELERANEKLKMAEAEAKRSSERAENLQKELEEMQTKFTEKDFQHAGLVEGMNNLLNDWAQ